MKIIILYPKTSIPSKVSRPAQNWIYPILHSTQNTDITLNYRIPKQIMCYFSSAYRRNLSHYFSSAYGGDLPRYNGTTYCHWHATHRLPPKPMLVIHWLVRAVSANKLVPYLIKILMVISGKVVQHALTSKTSQVIKTHPIYVRSFIHFDTNIGYVQLNIICVRFYLNALITLRFCVIKMTS